MVSKKPLSFGKKIKIGAVAVVAVGITSAGYFLLTGNNGQPFFVPAYTVSRVIDGDTFVTTENQYIRIASTDAPELSRCGGPEAKAELEKIVLGKPVYLKVNFRDPYQRLVSFVYTTDGFVNEKMLSAGYSYFSRGSPGETGERLSVAGEKTRLAKKGIFGPPCTQETNLEKPKCDIKGNTVSKIYYLPGCGNYDHVSVQLYLGDVWFCSEKEALIAGFRKPQQCSN